MFRSVCLLLLAISSSAIADITEGLDNYIQLDCELKPIKSRGRKARRHKPHIPSKVQPRIQDAVNATLHANSTNWSGYAVATNLASKTGSVTDVTGSWVVPKLLPTSQRTFSSFWVGIDGYSSNSVEQLGTEHDWVSGQQQNYAWIEMFPNYAVNISGFPLNVGDVIEAEVKYLGVVNGKQNFQLSLVNHTHQAFFTKKLQPAKSAGKVGTASAEWIAEAPAIASGVTPLSDFQTGVFTNCTATINGVKGGIVNSKWQTVAITMISENGSQTKAVPSAVGSDKGSFTDTWKSSGP